MLRYPLEKFGTWEKRYTDKEKEEVTQPMDIDRLIPSY
jgi:hypothetical protein